jgi:hypothetical protein
MLEVQILGPTVYTCSPGRWEDRGVDRLMRTAVVLQDNLLATEALVAELLFATWGASRCNDWVARAVSWVEGVTATV